MLTSLPLKRLDQTREMAHPLEYVVENDFFTGRTVEMDGGLRVILRQLKDARPQFFEDSLH